MRRSLLPLPLSLLSVSSVRIISFKKIEEAFIERVNKFTK